MSAAVDRVDVRPAAPKDVPAVVGVLSHALCFKLEDNFAAKLEHAVANKIYPGESGSFSCIVAELNKKVIGAIVTITINLHQAIASGRFSYELLKNIKEDTELVFVKALAVERAHRQQGVGRELLYAGVRDLAMGSKRVGAALFYAPSGHAPSAEFMEALRFGAFGYVPNFYAAKDGADCADERYDAVAWVTALNEFQLQEYKPAAGEEAEDALLDLTSPTLAARKVKRLPSWLRSLLLQYLLPFGVVGLVFALTYLFVLYGPADRLGLTQLVQPPGSRGAGSSGSGHAGGSDAAAAPTFVPGHTLEFDEL